MPPVDKQPEEPRTWEARYRRAELDVLALADVIEALLKRRVPSRTSRVVAERRLARMKERYGRRSASGLEFTGDYLRTIDTVRRPPTSPAVIRNAGQHDIILRHGTGNLRCYQGADILLQPGEEAIAFAARENLLFVARAADVQL